MLFLPDRYPDETPAIDTHGCPACAAARDALMSWDHDFDRTAAADPANDPSHRDASDREWQEWLDVIAPAAEFATR